jgi:hypothetical protein
MQVRTKGKAKKYGDCFWRDASGKVLGAPTFDTYVPDASSESQKIKIK